MQQRIKTLLTEEQRKQIDRSSAGPGLLMRSLQWRLARAGGGQLFDEAV